MNRARYNAVANYLRAVAKRMSEALNGAENIVSMFAAPAEVLAKAVRDANAITNCVRRLEQDPEGANIVRLQDAGAFADEIATYFGARKDLESRFLHSQFLVDDMHNRIVVLPNEFAEPLITLWMAYDVIRNNGAEIAELRSAWTDIDKRLRAAEQASADKVIRESSPAKRAKMVLAGAKPVASASPGGRSADKREGDRQLRNRLKGAKLSDDSKGHGKAKGKKHA